MTSLTTTTSTLRWRLFPPPNQKKKVSLSWTARYPFAVGDYVYERISSTQGVHGVLKQRVNDETKTDSPTTDTATTACDNTLRFNSGEDNLSKHTLMEGPKKQQHQHSKWIMECHNEGDDDSSRERTVSSQRLVPCFLASKPNHSSNNNTDVTILVTSETTPFRQLAASQLRRPSLVVEVGCSTGETALRLVAHPCTRAYIGLDTSPQMVETTRDKLLVHHNNPGCWQVHCLNALMEPDHVASLIRTEQDRMLLLRNTTNNDATNSSTTDADLMFFVDIGGNREWQGVVSILEWVLRHFSSSSCLCVVLKSRVVYQTLQSQASVNDGAVGGSNNSLDWLRRQQPAVPSRKRIRHPLQAPKAYNPDNPNQPICRYHNYHKTGCARHNNNKALLQQPATAGDDRQDCPFDHAHCHFCLELGHIALKCPLMQQS